MVQTATEICRGDRSMIFKTKFDLGDAVWCIGFGTRSDWVPCAFCNGKGRITGHDGSNSNCPECYGRKGRDENHTTQWKLNHQCPATVGQIRVMEQAAGGRYFAEKEERYMLWETGVGSGTVHKADCLFASKEEAIDECHRRNTEMET